jgi:signal transduction histidine kinase/DNA-binding response OmpR family regulator
MSKIKYSVLVVDDQETGIALLKKILSPEYNIYSANNGKDAISIAKTFMPDIILLDVMMPEMDGYDVIKILRETKTTKNIPVIFLTTLDRDEEEEKGLLLGASDYIIKPYSPAIVKLRVRNQINMFQQLYTIEEQIESIKSLEYENVKNMLESTPYSCCLWNRDSEILDCNQASLDLFNAISKNYFLENFHKFSPEFQPDGTLSAEKAQTALLTALDEGKCVFEYVYNTITGILIPCEITLVRIKLQSDFFVVAYMKDLREYKAMAKEINRQEDLLFTVNSVAGILLQSNNEDFIDDMYLCMGMMAKAVDVHRVYIWKNYIENDELYCTQIYEWSEGAEPQQDNEYTVGISYKESVPEWEDTLNKNVCINSIVKNMTPASQAQLSPQGILSIFIAPIFLRDNFWGFIGFDDCEKERVFSDNEELILRSAGLLIANSMIKNEMTVNLKSSAEQLQAALVEARAASTAKSDFLSNMSHEIRTPMNAIVGMGELLEHEQLNERQAGYVGDIITSAKSLLGIINDILDFSKIESGKLELNPVDYDFKMLIENIKSMFSYIAGKKGLNFIVERADNLPHYLYGDDIRLRQTLINILGNAVKFTQKGSVTLKVTTENDSLVFEIKDTGVGIRKEDIPTLFSAFAQVDKSKNRNVVGTGLGLAISKSFAEMMGGNIILESEYGQGTVFTITLPIAIGNKERIINQKADKKSHNIHAPDAKILVVDDNEFNLKVASGLLRLQGIEAVTVDSGARAIEEITEKSYDLVFMDHMMPEMDGIETTARLRKMGSENQKYEALPIIALTANAVFGAREMFLANGFNDFISKPIDTSELVRILKTWLPPEKVSESEYDASGTSSAGTAENNIITELGKIRELNTEIGLSRVSDIEEMYFDSIIFFNKKLLTECEKMSAALREKDILTFTIIVHAIKSALSTIGAMELSEAAAALEEAAKNNEAAFCAANYPPLQEKLQKLHEQLSAVFPNAEHGTPGTPNTGDEALLRESIEKAIAAAEDSDSDLGIEIIEGVIEYDFGGERNALLEAAMTAFNDFDCSEAAENLKLIKT